MKRELNFIDGRPLLYIVATPIGNLSEMTPRAIEILSLVAAIGCEDTRKSKLLLDYFLIKKPLISCHEHNENEAGTHLLNLLKEGKSVAYISDAGYPGISDPGQRLIAHALDMEINVSVISGSSALLLGLIGSGLDTSHFYFHGFLESKESSRLNELQELFKRQETLVFYESPHRIGKTLNNMLSVFGTRKACIARELTKKHEEYIRGNLSDLAQIDPITLKGEMVIIVEGNNNEIKDAVDDDKIMQYIKSLTEVGLSTKDAIRHTSLILKINKNYIYKTIHRN